MVLSKLGAFTAPNPERAFIMHSDFLPTAQPVASSRIVGEPPSLLSPIFQEDDLPPCWILRSAEPPIPFS